MLFRNVELRKMYGLEASLHCKNGLQIAMIPGSYLSLDEKITEGRVGIFSGASVDDMRPKKCNDTWWTIKGTRLAEQES